ncbi:MAG: NfeD family protein [Methanomicrobiales archaeon]|nr:NfeD family protein [Methanomicrobiales archaeon]NYT20598.1 NfeD family protein [Methanomicrobiales archaeon]
MADQISLTIGWIMIIIGTVFLVAETLNPGFFIAVPGTVLIILGVLFVIGVDVFSSPAGIILGVFIALAASVLTIWIYRRINPDEASPTTISRDSLLGREGIVIRKVIPDSLSGKVLVAGQEWSARSEGGEIAAGVRVKVVRSEGVHIVVEEVGT